MEKHLIQPIVGLLISSAIALRAYRRKSLDLSGALAGFIVLTIHISLNYRHVSLSLNFFTSWTVENDFLDSLINWSDEFVDLGLCCLLSFSLLRNSPKSESRKSESSTRNLKREVNATGKFPSTECFWSSYLADWPRCVIRGHWNFFRYGLNFRPVVFPVNVKSLELEKTYGESCKSYVYDSHNIN